jgi:predicted phage terminase large subunit-like protein
MATKSTKDLATWRQYKRDVAMGTLPITSETTVKRAKRIANLEAEPEEWFAYYFPAYAYAQPAQFHIDATSRVLSHTEWCEVRMWSRELAKSTRTMMEVLYLTLAGHPPAAGGSRFMRCKKKCVLLISSTLDSAERLLAPYRINLECNKRLIADYGKQVGDIWRSSEFLTRDGVSFRAIGAGQSPRGTRNEATRPDIILFDDIDTDAECLNPELVARKWRWIEEAAVGTRSVSVGTTIIFCGNRIAWQSCIQHATHIADHTDLRNIRTAEGTSAWPQKNTEEDIDRVLAQKSYAAQQKEYFNNPLSEGVIFKELYYKPCLHPRQYKHLVCYTDPSYKDSCDYKATVLLGFTGSEYHVLRCFVEQTTTAQLLDWHYQIADFLEGAYCKYYMEQVFMQDVILKEITDACIRNKKHMSIVGDKRKKADKFTRIESLLEPMVRNGTLVFNEAEKDNPHMKRLAAQFAAFAPGSRAHDDGPDAVEGAVWKLQEIVGIAHHNGIHLSPHSNAKARLW